MTTAEAHFDQNGPGSLRRRICLPHGPHLVVAVEVDRYVVRARW